MGWIKKSIGILHNIDDDLDWEIKFILAQTLREIGEVKIALEYIDEAIKLALTSEDRVGLLVYKVDILINNQRQEEALDIFKNENQTDEAILGTMTGVAISMENWNLAEKYAKEMLKVNPESEMAFIYLGGVYLKKGDYKKALDNYNVVTLSKDNERVVLGGLVASYLELEELEEAERICKELNAKYRGHPTSIFSQAKLEFKRGNMKEANKLLKYLEPHVSVNKEQFEDIYSKVKSKIED